MGVKVRVQYKLISVKMAEFQVAHTVRESMRGQLGGRCNWYWTNLAGCMLYLSCVLFTCIPDLSAICMRTKRNVPSAQYSNREAVQK